MYLYRESPCFVTRFSAVPLSLRPNFAEGDAEGPLVALISRR